MTFTSLIFLLFLPAVLAVYWLVGYRKVQNALLVGASYFFYGYWDYRFCFLMLASSLIDFTIGLALGRTEAVGRRKALLMISLFCNLGLLGVFKYFNFFVDNFRMLAETFGFSTSTGTWEIILPIGISFYTFQTLSYTIDIYRRQLNPTDKLIDYLAFVSFFPQLVAGPIERAARLLPQFQSVRHWQWENLYGGTRRILWGFFKKIVIADTLAVFVVEAYGDPVAATGPQLILATVFFALQIYCDFSAYSDIAIGAAQLFDIKLMRNFAYPYFSQSIWEFWQRWHISLSTWFRDYVYIPMGGNRVSRKKRNGNIVATFLLSGLWHGAAWQFIAWGGLHGAATIGLRPARERQADFDLNRPAGSAMVPSLRIAVRIMATFTAVCILWVFFRADSLGTALMILQKMSMQAYDASAIALLARDYLTQRPLFGAINLLVVFVAIEWVRRNASFPLDIGHWPQPLRWCAYTTVFWLVVDYADKSPGNPFIYFQF